LDYENEHIFNIAYSILSKNQENISTNLVVDKRTLPQNKWVGIVMRNLPETRDVLRDVHKSLNDFFKLTKTI
jgi:hypothetical protein